MLTRTHVCCLVALAAALILMPQTANAVEKMSLLTQGLCVEQPEDTTTIEVELSQIDPGNPILGANINLEWDPNSCWQVIDIVPGEGFEQIGENVGPGFVRYAINRDAGEPGITETQVIASITFQATIPPDGCCVEEICLAAGCEASATKVFGVQYESVPEFGPCVEVRIDREDPSIICPEDLIREAFPGRCFWRPSGGDPIIQPEVDDNCECQLIVTGERSDGLPLNGNYPVGETFITWTVIDCCGNSSSCEQRICVVDKEPPVIDPDGGIIRRRADEECKYVLPDVRELVTITDNCDPDPNVEQEPPPGTVFGLGCFDVVVAANDNHGNNTVATFRLCIEDLTPPEFTTAPDNIEVYADAGKCTAKVEWEVSAKDNCNGPITLECIPPSGSLFPICQTTQVTCTATDASENQTVHQFTVTVLPFWKLFARIGYKGLVSPRPFSRCIQFELVDCDEILPTSVVEGVFTFEGGIAEGIVLVPVNCSTCVEGEYTCMRARDIRHSLWSRVEAPENIQISPDGTMFMARWLGENALQLGNLNGDSYVDVADWIIWMLQFTGVNPLPPLPVDLCSPLPNPANPAEQHGDLNGDTRVTAADYGHIYLNMWQQDDAECCTDPAPCPDCDLASPLAKALDAPAPLKAGPRARISVNQLKAMGLDAAVEFDFNGDGYVGVSDMVLYGRKK